MLVLTGMTYLNWNSVKYALHVCKGKSQKLNFASLKGLLKEPLATFIYFVKYCISLQGFLLLLQFMPCPTLEFQLLCIELGKQNLENVMESHQSKLKLKMVWSEGLLNSMDAELHSSDFKKIDTK